MIQSMTGFGRGEAANEKYKVTIEMKSVNHRYLDLSVRLPRKLNFYEPAIRNQVKEFAKRGKIDIFVSMEQLQENAESIQYNPQIAAAYLSGISQMADEFSIDGTIQAYQLARFPDVFTKAEEDDNEAGHSGAMSLTERVYTHLDIQTLIDGINMICPV